MELLIPYTAVPKELVQIFSKINNAPTCLALKPFIQHAVPSFVRSLVFLHFGLPFKPPSNVYYVTRARNKAVAISSWGFILKAICPPVQIALDHLETRSIPFVPVTRKLGRA